MDLPKISICAPDAKREGSHDATVVIFHDLDKLNSAEACSVLPALQRQNSVDSSFASGTFLHISAPNNVVISTGLGPLNRDYDDVRRYADAAKAAIRRLKNIKGIVAPHIIIQAPPVSADDDASEYSHGVIYKNYFEVAILAILGELYDPLEVRISGIKSYSIEHVTFSIDGSFQNNFAMPEQIASFRSYIEAVEIGSRLAKDIGSPDSEIMSPINCALTIEKFFETASNVNVQVIGDYEVMKTNYPLFAAVGRASMHVPRHAPRIVKLEYRSPRQGDVEEELIYIGKGITFDTGGADVKHSGAMLGMSRDKCGAAALAGLMATCSKLQPTHVNLTIWLAFVRNSIGSNSYVCDEIIRARSGIRVRVGNTDAEGRMAMADLLCEARERVIRDGLYQKARLFTCATLTGHVIRAYGPGYSAVMVNGPAKKLGVHKRLINNGEACANPFEHSNIRREDYAMVQPIDNRYDVLQANDKPSTLTPRGHQFPMAFLAITSGLDKHDSDAKIDTQIPFAHLDVAGSTTDTSDPYGLGRVTSSPIPALAAAFLRGPCRRIV